MLSRWLNWWWTSCEFIFSETGLELLSCLGYILVHKGIAIKLLFVHNKRGRVMEVRSMTSSPGLPLPLSQGWPTAAIWFIWKFYPCFPSPSSLIQTTWVRSLICMSQLKSASNQYTYIVDPAEHCQLLHRLPHHLPLRGGHLCSRLWDSVHQSGEDPGCLPIYSQLPFTYNSPGQVERLLVMMIGSSAKNKVVTHKPAPVAVWNQGRLRNSTSDDSLSKEILLWGGCDCQCSTTLCSTVV